MEPEGSLQGSQEPSTCPHPEPDRSSPCHPPHFPKIHLSFGVIRREMTDSIKKGKVVSAQTMKAYGGIEF